jgi:hypothetical protein
MKRTMLILAVLSLVTSGFSQKKPSLKNDLRSCSTVQAGHPDAIAAKTKPITTALVSPPLSIKGSREINFVSIISIGTSVNAYSYGYGGGQKSILYANNDINTVTHIHRMGGALDPGGYSGDLGVDVSTNGGLTFTNMHEIYTSTVSGGTYNTDAARYPNHGIYNPEGNTNPSNAYITIFAPNLDGSNAADSWGGYSYGRAKINSYTDTTKHLISSNDPYFQYIPDAYDVSQDGIAIAVDANQDWTTGSVVYLGSLLVSHGVWDEDEEDFIFTRSLIDFPTNAENDRPSHVSFAFGPDGQTGWIAVISDNESVTPLTGLRYFYPIFIRTDDGGQTWDDPIAVRLDGPDGLPGVLNYLTDDQIAELFEPPLPARDEIPYTTAFDCDLVVDMWGNPHLSVVIGVGASTEYSIITATETFAAFDISTTDGGTTWDAWMCGKAQQFRGTFGTDYTEDNRIQASSTQDGSKVFIAWLDTQLEGAEENNSPDIYARGIDVSAEEDYRCLSTDPNGDDLPDCVTAYSEAMWQAYFAVTSRITLDDGEGAYTIPFSYEALTTPFDPALPVQYKYIQDFTFTDDDFLPVIPDTADIDVIPTTMTIYQTAITGQNSLPVTLSDDTLMIYNIGDGELTITSITTAYQWILLSGTPNTPFEIEPGSSQAVMVSIDWAMLGGETASGTIVINSDDYDEPVVEVSVTAIPSELPDLTIQEQTVSPANLEAGSTTIVSCNVANLGNTMAPESMLRYYLSDNNTYGSGDVELGANVVESLDTGQVSFQQDTLLIPANTEAGQWFIIFMADADYNIMEFDESNNDAYFAINVLINPPDLIVQNAEADSLEIDPGETTNVACDVFNQGEGSAGSSVLNYYLSADNVYGEEDILLGYSSVGSLEPGESAGESLTLGIPADTEPGEWFILFFADAENEVDESDENNNVANVPITVNEPFSIAEGFESGIKAYPNPLKDILYLEISGLDAKPEALKIVNSLGNVVCQYPDSQLHPGSYTFNLKDLASGVYVVRIEFEKGPTKEMIILKE